MNEVPMPPTLEEQKMAVNIPHPKTPGFSFLRIISLSMLVVVVISFINFISAVVDYTFPSKEFNFLNPYDTVKTSLPIFVASFIVLIFSLLFLRYKRIKAHDTTYSVVWRRVLYTLFTLLGLWLFVDFISIIRMWLDGDLAIRSVIKVITSVVVVFTVAGYYIAELKGIWVTNTSKHIIYLGAVSTATLITIIVSFVFIGSPTFHRNVVNDIEKRNSLENLVYYMDCGCYFASLPKDNKEFQDKFKENSSDEYIKDASDDTLFTYQKIDDTHYNLCADFSLDSQITNDYVKKYDRYYSTTIEWNYSKDGCQSMVYAPKYDYSDDNSEEESTSTLEENN